MFAYKIDILFQVLFYVFYLYSFVRTSGNAFRKPPCYPHAIITAGIKIRDKLRKDYPKGTGQGTGFAAGAAHLVTFDVAVGGALQRIVITGIDARRFFAMAADSGKGSILAQRGDTVILGMIKIVAKHPAFFTLAANIQVYK